MKRGGSSISETRDSTELFGIHGIGDRYAAGSTTSSPRGSALANG
jgi:hypothetical protein